MTPRDLIAAGRAAGFRRWKPALTGMTLVWTCTAWRVDVELHPKYAFVEVLRADRWPGQWVEVGTLYLRTAGEIASVLSALGVLPSPTGVAA